MTSRKKGIVAAFCAVFALCGGLCFAEDGDYYLEVDEYLGQPVESVEAMLGTPSEDDVDIIYADYKCTSALDPEYSMYFPSEELKDGVKVRIVVWESAEICSIVWARQDFDNYGDWIVFTSVAHDDNIKFK